MKALIAILALSLAAPAAAEAPKAQTEVFDPVHLQKAMHVVELVIPPSQRDAMFRAVIDSMTSNMLKGMMDADPDIQKTMDSNPDLKPVFERFIARQRTFVIDDLKENMPSLMLAYGHAYARQFSPAELDEIAAFFSTPAGAKYVQRATALLTDPDVAEWQRRLAATSHKRMPEEMKKFLEEIGSALASHKEDKRHGT